MSVLLAFVSYGCETWSLALSDNSQTKSDNREQRRFRSIEFSDLWTSYLKLNYSLQSDAMMRLESLNPFPSSNSSQWFSRTTRSVSICSAYCYFTCSARSGHLFMDNRWYSRSTLKKGYFGKSNILQEEDSFHQQNWLKFKERSNVPHLVYSLAWCWNLDTLGKKDQKFLGSSEMWCWRRMEKISWTNCVRNEVLHRIKEEKNILHAVNKEECHLYCLHLALDLLSRTRYWNTGRRKDRSDGKTRNKT